MTTLELDTQTYERLLSAAQAQGLSPTAYIDQLLTIEHGTNLEKITRTDLAQILEHVGDLFVLKTADTGRIIHVNPAYEDFFQQSVDRLYADPRAFLERVHPEDRLIVENHLNRHLEGESSMMVYRVLLDDDDEPRWYRSRAFPIYDDEGELFRVAAVVEDISIEEHLRHTLEEYAQFITDVVESIQDAFFMIDRDWCFVYANKEAIDLFQKSESEIIGESMLDLFPDIHERQYHEMYSRAFDTNEVVSFEEYHEDTDLWLRITVYPSKRGLSIYLQKINELKKAQRELEDANEQLESRVRERTQRIQEVNAQLLASERRYRSISELSMDFAFSYHVEPDKTTELEWVTDAFSTITQLKASDIPNLQAHLRFAHPDDVATYQAHMMTLFETVAVIQFEYRIVALDGSVRHVFMRARSEDDHSGAVSRIIGVVQDISAQKEVEMTLAEERDLLEQVMATAPVGIMTLDSDGLITYVNPRMATILRTPVQRLVGTSYRDQDRILSVDGVKIAHKAMPYARVAENLEVLNEMRYRLDFGDDTEHFIAVSGAPLFTDEGELRQVVLCMEDITEREAAMRREKELNTLKSRFVTLVSHELRTPMTLISTSAQIVARKAEMISPEDITKRMSNIRKQIKRLTNIMDDVAFINKVDAVGHKVELQALNLETLVHDYVRDLQIVHDSMPTVEFMCNCDGAAVMTDVALLERIIGNLLSNAFKYTPETGAVHVTCGVEGNIYYVEVRDTGVGIPEEEQAQLFDNFFRSTKVGNVQGTGLGMGIIHRAVHTLGGHIDWESKEQVGSRFRVMIPRPML